MCFYLHNICKQLGLKALAGKHISKLLHVNHGGWYIKLEDGEDDHDRPENVLTVGVGRARVSLTVECPARPPPRDDDAILGPWAPREWLAICLLSLTAAHTHTHSHTRPCAGDSTRSEWWRWAGIGSKRGYLPYLWCGDMPGCGRPLHVQYTTNVRSKAYLIVFSGGSSGVKTVDVWLSERKEAVWQDDTGPAPQSPLPARCIYSDPAAADDDDDDADGRRAGRGPGRGGRWSMKP